MSKNKQKLSTSTCSEMHFLSLCWSSCLKKGESSRHYPFSNSRKNLWQCHQYIVPYDILKWIQIILMGYTKIFHTTNSKYTRFIVPITAASWESITNPDCSRSKRRVKVGRFLDVWFQKQIAIKKWFRKIFVMDQVFENFDFSRGCISKNLYLGTSLCQKNV